MTTAFRTPDDINPEDIRKVADRLDGMKRGPIAEIWNVVRALWKLTTDPRANWGSRLLALGALLYLVSPIDLIPDAIPIIGLTDDAGVIMAAAGKIADDLKKYLE
jgi:uncharacterized membrane protein YkvA (DUF1232 family)